MGAEVVAAVHDDDKRGKGAGALLRQAFGNCVVAALDLDHRIPLFRNAPEILGQPMQVMRSEHQADKRILPLAPLGHALLLRHATARADQDIRPFPSFNALRQMTLSKRGFLHFKRLVPAAPVRKWFALRESLQAEAGSRLTRRASPMGEFPLKRFA